MIGAARLSVDEISGVQCPIVDFQFAVQQVQFFDSPVNVARIVRSGVKQD